MIKDNDAAVDLAGFGCVGSMFERGDPPRSKSKRQRVKKSKQPLITKELKLNGVGNGYREERMFECMNEDEESA